MSLKIYWMNWKIARKEKKIERLEEAVGLLEGVDYGDWDDNDE